jgi:pSer/pThr/pTyr-binding forkhead associated (FHA) protein
MAETVRLTVLTGPHKGHRFCFRGPNEFEIGRAADCLVRLNGDVRDLCISRHHCQVYVDPPCVRVQDLGSRNGTFLNGHNLEQDGSAKDQAELFENGSPIGFVRHGDIITVGGHSLRVDIMACPPPLPGVAEFGFGWKEGEKFKKDCSVDC